LLTEIDDLLLPEYYYLDDSDECYSLREYTAGKGYAFSKTNNLISNFKKSPTLQGTGQWYYKGQAIEQFAIELQSSLNLDWLGSATLVPIPPSKAPDHPEYDDRMLQLLQTVSQGLLDIRELLYQEESMDAAHASERRPRPEEIAENYRVNEDLLEPDPEVIGLFDDVLTTGAHFKAAKRVLRRHFPATPIVGIFLARTVRLKQAGDAPQLP
jgi:hypothetical protein